MRRSRLIVLGVIIVVFVLVAYVAYESLPGTQHNTTTTTVSTAANLVAVMGQSTSSTCYQPTGTYGNKSLTIAWGNLAPGTEGIQFLCIENTGTIGVTLTVTSDLSPSVGKVTSPQAGTVLNGKGAELMELDLWLPSNIATGPMSSFTITIGGSS